MSTPPHYRSPTPGPTSHRPRCPLTFSLSSTTTTSEVISNLHSLSPSPQLRLPGPQPLPGEFCCHGDIGAPREGGGCLCLNMEGPSALLAPTLAGSLSSPHVRSPGPGSIGEALLASPEQSAASIRPSPTRGHSRVTVILYSVLTQRRCLSVRPPLPLPPPSVNPRPTRLR